MPKKDKPILRPDPADPAREPDLPAKSPVSKATPELSCQRDQLFDAQFLILTLVKDGNLRLGKIPCADASLKESIQLRDRSPLCFWQAEKGPGENYSARTRPDEASLATEIPCPWVEDGRIQKIGPNADDVVRVAGQDRSLDAQACARNLCYEAVADWANGEIIRDDEDHHQGTRSPANGIYAGRDAHEAHSQKDSEHNAETDEMESSAPHVREEKPGAYGAGQRKGLGANTKVE
ncbi:hypothetical protein MRS44_008391 [Fusarium solani]|uniref:uncharacterized protein n=1 Tax=Fusarium solani TaxID=169388 RepID=UPI0032C3DD80|nr:hypothetical protein MRS44_008391 [Fusarium solani]